MSEEPKTPEVREPLHPLLRLASLSAVIFIVTTLAMVATVFGDQQAPVNQFLNRHGITLIGVEVVVTLFLAILALSADRRRTRQKLEEQAFNQSVANTKVDAKTREGEAPAEPQL